jgi:hypothetical protein
LGRKLAYFKKADTNWEGSWLISKKLTRVGKEADLFQKSWHEFAKKLNFSRKQERTRQRAS